MTYLFFLISLDCSNLGCWTEHWIDYFVDLGYPIMAISLRGTGGTFAGIGVKKVKIDEHAADIRAFLKEVDQLLLLKTKKDTQIRLMKPVIVSHSFGGAAVTKYMETYPDELSQMSATIFLCSVPPSGNGDMTIRFLRRSLVRAWKITAGFAMKKSIVDADLCRDLFFGGPKIELEEKQEDGTVVTAVEDYGVSDEDIERYQGYFKRDTVATLDVSDFVKRLPSKQWVDGCAPFLSRLPPCLVVGATRDFIVDQEGVEETAKYFGVSPLLVDSPHDIMIGANWKRGADEIYKWLQENGL
jgi:pimeloyl-ACP methyl ester carboxylesterase